MIDFAAVDFKARETRPVLGPALWLFGAMLWAYVIVGQLVVEEGFPEMLGLLGLLFVIGVTWFFAIERSFSEDPPTPETRLARIVRPFALAFGLWLLTTLLSTVIGMSTFGNLDSAITLTLWSFSLIPFFVGRRMTGGRAASIDKSRRPLGILLWIGAALVTVVAPMSLGTNSASEYAITSCIRKAMTNGVTLPPDPAITCSRVLPSAAIHCLANTMYQAAPSAMLATAATTTAIQFTAPRFI